MTDDHRVRLLRAISASSRPLDDDELSQRTGIQPRQAVNQVLRRLAREGVVQRHAGPSSKIVTELMSEDDGPAEVSPAAAPANPDRVQNRDAQPVMLDLLGHRIGRALEPATIRLQSGARVEIDGSDVDRTVLVECWAHQGSPKGGQKHKVLTDALKPTWIASTIYPRPFLILCMSHELAAAPFQPGSKSWAAQALQDLGVRVELIALPEHVRQAVVDAQERQYR